MEYRILPPPEPAGHFQRSHWASEDLDAREPSRRQWLAGLACGVVGAAMGVAVDRIAFGDSIAQREGLGWLDWMLALPESDLIRFAGVFETVSLEDEVAQSSSALHAAFERLFMAALSSEGPWSDRAGACAVRVLARGDNRDALRACERALGGRDRPLTTAAMRQAGR